MQYFYKPLLLLYLRRDRYCNYKGIRILVKRGVFHPDFFFSTKFLLGGLEKENFQGKTLLELGAGSGLISFYAAKQGAIVTATDISTIAIEGLKINQQKLNLQHSIFRILQTDLFENIPVQPFDYILLNPPFYAREIKNEAELGWNAGKELEYFTKLFTQMHQYVHPATLSLMVFPDIPELEMVKEIASRSGWKMELIRLKNLWYEKMMLFSITKL